MSPPIEFEFTPDRRYTRRVFGHARRASRAGTAALAVVLILAGFGAITADEWAILFGLLALAVGFALVARLVISLGLGIQRVPAAWYAPRQYALDADEMAVHSQRFTAALRWDAFARATKIADGYLIHFATMQGFIDLPTGPLSAEQRAAVEAKLTEHGLLEEHKAPARSTA